MIKQLFHNVVLYNKPAFILVLACFVISNFSLLYSCNSLYKFAYDNSLNYIEIVGYDALRWC
jgi:hypothetical protein